MFKFFLKTKNYLLSLELFISTLDQIIFCWDILLLLMIFHRCKLRWGKNQKKISLMPMVSIHWHQKSWMCWVGQTNNKTNNCQSESLVILPSHAINYHLKIPKLGSSNNAHCVIVSHSTSQPFNVFLSRHVAHLNLGSKTKKKHFLEKITKKEIWSKLSISKIDYVISRLIDSLLRPPEQLKSC